MKRRTVLAGAGIALTSAVAGCLTEANDPDESGTGNGNGNGNGDSDADCPGSTNGFDRRVAVQDVDEVPGSVPVEFDVQVTESAITADGTGLLEVVVTNTGDTERTVRTPFYKGPSEGDRRIILHSLEAPDSPDRGYVPACIEEPDPRQEFVEWTDEAPLGHTLEPGETGTGELVVVDDPSAESCFPPGEYRFETTHTIDGTEFSWGFTVGVVNCPGGDDPGGSVGRRYEECPREVIPYDQFPADVQAEIDAALDGGYESDRVFLREAMDLEQSFVSIDGEYYEATVTTEGGTERLALQLVEPKVLPRKRPVSVELDRESQRTVTAELVAGDGTILIERTRELRPGSEVEFGQTTRVGTHELRVTVADDDGVEDELTESVTIGESRFSILAIVGSDGIDVTGAVAELGVCRYDTETGLPTDG